MNTEPYFSVIIPTRNKAAEFEKAIQSVLNQSFANIEIIVVNDGSSETQLDDYQLIYDKLPNNCIVVSLPNRTKGHGPGFARNTGVARAKGLYLCFLDDDDEWTDQYYLERAQKLLAEKSNAKMAYYANQLAYSIAGLKLEEKLWVFDLKDKLAANGVPLSEPLEISVDQILMSSGFAHMNCSVINRSLYEEIGGYDESLRYEGDRDLFYRTIDHAEGIIYDPQVIAKHHVPDKSKKNNTSTLVNSLEKKLYQIRLLEKGLLFSKHSVVANHCRLGLSFLYKHIAMELYQLGKFKRSYYYAARALSVKFTFKWYAWTKFVWLKSIYRDI